MVASYTVRLAVARFLEFGKRFEQVGACVGEQSHLNLHGCHLAQAYGSFVAPAATLFEFVSLLGIREGFAVFAEILEDFRRNTHLYGHARGVFGGGGIFYGLEDIWLGFLGSF